MRPSTLLRRSLAYYWRTNLAVVAGVAVAVAVLAGALVVGDSVRASLRSLFLQRLGRADTVVSSANFFREQLADEIRTHDEFARVGLEDVCPLVVLEASVATEEGGGRAAGVQVYGVNERFWKFHGRDGSAAPRGREVLLSEALAAELEAKAGEAVLLRVRKPSAIPADSLHGRKEETGRTVRLTLRETLGAAQLGEFSLRPQQGSVRAAFVPLKLLQQDLEQDERVNAILISRSEGDAEASEEAGAARVGAVEKILRERVALEDLGIRLRALAESKSVSVETESSVVSDELAESAREAAARAGLRATSVLSYLANTIEVRGREVPYSIVTAVDEESFARLAESANAAAATRTADANGEPPILINEWTARDLGAQAGDRLTLEYYLWRDDGRLTTERARMRVAGVVPMRGLAADRDLVPRYPGITESQSLSDWDPPFPIDLRRVRDQDETYWDEYRTTPKAFVTLAEGQRLWRTRYGRLTSLRVAPNEDATADAAQTENANATTDVNATLDAYGRGLRERVDPARMSFAVVAARAEGVAASRGATDFGEYFLYFSFFLVVSALLLTVLFFRLGVEQRLREIGLLRAFGFDAARVRRLFLGEAAVLSVAGSVAGVAGALLYGWLMMAALRTWWVGAVGTTMLELHVSPASLAAGALGGVVAALACIVWTLRRLAPASPRSLLAGVWEAGRRKEKGKGKKGETLATRARSTGGRTALVIAFVGGTLGLSLLASAAAGVVAQAAGFFGGGTLLLVALLAFQSAWLRRGGGPTIAGSGAWPVSRLGFRNATRRPGRSVLCVALIASAAFIIVAVDAFRRDGGDEQAHARNSGSGGYPLLAETALPVIHDPNTREGREALNLSDAGDSEGGAGEANGATAAARPLFTAARFRLRPGDDASCLNLYEPRRPRILAPSDDFIDEGRFAFAASLAETDEERRNPWLLLRRDSQDGVVPVIADANSLSYVLHRKLGEVFEVEGEGGQPVRLRVVASLADSVFQSELLVSEQNFLRHFPREEGFRFFLLDVRDPARANDVAALLEERLVDYGFDAIRTAERLATFHRVENTFLSTFQMLGGLGLVLGTLGLGAVLLRNVLERRRELALLRAVGYGPRHFALMVLAENAALLVAGLVTGTLCALLAIAPVVAARGGRLPVTSMGGLLLAVLVAGLLASLIATRAALRSPVLEALRAE